LVHCANTFPENPNAASSRLTNACCPVFSAHCMLANSIRNGP
jgi:hypothetical protein